MRQIMLLVLWVPALVSSELRNPFVSLSTKCTSDLAGTWRFMGVVHQGHILQGIINSGRGKWMRVVAGDELEEGWLIGSVSEHQIVLRQVEGCPAQEHILLLPGREKE
ncbi:HofP DNA utilization family protein [Mangrovibacter yixingensis]|uniref:HofP DNA utilization family protein n=1 Tax=Mangrovibacter yixingensis TaxID=1529639 RepID=UPI001CFE1C8A|nr:HofP DNA utilization family protein [Mangrovibacter yixingensis]